MGCNCSTIPCASNGAVTDLSHTDSPHSAFTPNVDTTPLSSTPHSVFEDPNRGNVKIRSSRSILNIVEAHDIAESSVAPTSRCCADQIPHTTHKFDGEHFTLPSALANLKTSGGEQRNLEVEHWGYELKLQDVLDICHICGAEHKLASGLLQRLVRGLGLGPGPSRSATTAEKVLAFLHTEADSFGFAEHIRQNLHTLDLHISSLPRLWIFMSQVDACLGDWHFDKNGDVLSPPIVPNRKTNGTSLSNLTLTETELGVLRLLAFVNVPPAMLDICTIKKLRDELLGGKPSASLGERPSAVVMVGSPGSGKTFVWSMAADELQKHGMHPAESFVHIDPDFWISRHCNNNNQVRPLANFLNHEAFLSAIGERKNLIFDSTGRSLLNTCGRVIARLKQANYRVFMCIVITSLSVCLQRISVRGAKTGRYVPEKLCREAVVDMRTNIPVYLRRHDELAEVVLLYDNSSNSPKLCSSLRADAPHTEEVGFAVSCVEQVIPNSKTSL